jgi:hypothetical protein
MIDQPKKLDKNKILTTTSRHILFDCLLKGMLVKDAAKEAKLSVKYAQNMVEYSGIKALALQTMAELSEKAQISIVEEQSSFKRIADKAEAEGKYSAAVQAHAYLTKSIGGFMAERPNPEATKGKQDAKRDDLLRAIADRVYAELYLAKPVDSVTVLDLRPLPGPTVNERGEDVQGQGQTERSSSGTDEAVQE